MESTAVNRVTRERSDFPLDRAQRVRGRAYESQSTASWFMRHVREVEASADVGGRNGGAFELPYARRDLSDVEVRVGSAAALRLPAALEATNTDAFMVLHEGRIVMEAYFGEMGSAVPHMWQSVSKSLASCVAANLVLDGRLHAEDPVVAHVPELGQSAYGDALVRDLLDMTVGIRYSEDYEDPDSDVCRLDRLYGAARPASEDEPGSSYEFATGAVKQGAHGQRFDYVSLNTQVLGWVMERASAQSLPRLIAEEVWGKLGTEHDAYIALDGAGSAQAEGGFCSSLRDMARFGLALVRNGFLNGHVVVPPTWLDDARRGADRARFAGSDFAALYPGGAYRNNFWINGEGDGAVLAGLGIYGQMLHVDHAADVVIAKFSTWPRPFDESLARLQASLASAVSAALAGTQ